MPIYTYKGQIIEAVCTEDVVKCFEFETIVRDNSSDIISSWCLCYYYIWILQNSVNLSKATQRLKEYLKKVTEFKFSSIEDLALKRSKLKELWIDGFASNPNAVIAEFKAKFDKEGIEENEEIYTDIAKEFGYNVTTLCNLICDEDYSKIVTYVDRWIEDQLSYKEFLEICEELENERIQM